MKQFSYESRVGEKFAWKTDRRPLLDPFEIDMLTYAEKTTVSS
jgi:hypothetical protein